MMTTGEPNPLLLTPVSGTVSPQTYAPDYRNGAPLGHFRSRPAERETTYQPRSVEPVSPIEKPTETAPTALPLEPARVPVPGSTPA
jgi:hypothetical protein